jgi:rhamnose transport system ATP-binding protein
MPPRIRDLPTPLLQATAIRKTFAGVQALKNVSFELLPGEVHALVGENGAGKSTLIKAMTGAIAADSGTLAVRGQAVAHNSPAVSRSLGIAAIYQQPALFPHLSVAENIALALETGHWWRRVDWKERNRRAREVIARAGGDIDPERLVRTLSMPEQQLVEIAKALAANARVLIMDEPSAALTEREVESLFQVIAGLRRQGAGIIYVSHRLEEIFAIADRVTVLRDGETVATCKTAEVSRSELIQMMVGREVAAVFPKCEVVIGETALEVRNLAARRGDLHDVSFSVRSGEILGLAGLVGSGRTELAETLFGLTPLERGEILLRGRPVRITSPVDAIALGIGYVPEDRRQHGVVLEMPIAANATLAILKAISRYGLLVSRRERDLAEQYVKQLRIKTPSVYAPAGTLSGGNQQKVALARWLAIQPSVLILDEPTQGIDVASKAEIHALMGELARRGLAILMISSELPEVLGMSDRVAVMHAGTISGVLSRQEASQEKVLAMALGHASREVLEIGP